MKRAFKAGDKQGNMDPVLLSILQAADFAELHERHIVPGLQRGSIVLANRYVRTSLARNFARGIDRNWIEDTFHFDVWPGLGIYFQISADQSIDHIFRHVDLQHEVPYRTVE